MVVCCVIGCNSRSGRDDAIKFHRVPSERVSCEPAMRALSVNRRALWLLRICREDLDDERAKKKGARVCSRHFVSGAPSILEDITNPDWAPSLNLGHDFFENERKLRKRKKESIKKYFCDSYVAFSKYQRSRKKSLKEEITDDGTLCTSKNACCYMNAEESDDSDDEGSMSSSEIAMPDSSESISNSLASNRPGDSTSNVCITHITVYSTDTCRRSVKSEDTSNTIQSEDTSLTPVSADIVLGAIKSEIDQSETDSNEFLLTAADSFSENFSDDDDSLENVQNSNLYEIPDKLKQTKHSIPISESKSIHASGHITHAEAFSAAETLLRYEMNQDEVNDVHVNFMLSFAQEVKEKMN